MKEALAALTALVGVFPSLSSCPPDVEQFLTLNGETYRLSSPAVLRVSSGLEEDEVVVARLGLRSNKCYSALSCSLLQGADLLLARNFQRNISDLETDTEYQNLILQN